MADVRISEPPISSDCVSVVANEVASAGPSTTATPDRPTRAESTVRRVNGSAGSRKWAKTPTKIGNVAKSSAARPVSIRCSARKMQA